MIEYTGKDLKEILEAMRKLILFCTDKKTWKLCDEIIVNLKEHDAKVRSEGESIGITRVLDILDNLDKQMLQMVREALYEQDFKEFKEKR